jgi:monothiol glutaredoxin
MLVWTTLRLAVRAYKIQWLTNECIGIKEYSEWPTIPQLYVEKEFIGGCDILMSMHQDGSLAKLLEDKHVLAPAEDAPSEPPK